MAEIVLFYIVGTHCLQSSEFWFWFVILCVIKTVRLIWRLCKYED